MNVEKIWLDHYQKGVPHQINSQEYTSLVDLFEESCQKFAEQTAYISFGSHFTYKQLDIKSKQFAAYLQSLGLKKGDRVALMMPNLIQYPIALFGILRAGLIAVNTNPLYTAEETAHQMKDSGAKAIIILANFAHTLQKALPQTLLEHIIITEIGDALPWPKGFIINQVVKYIKKMVPAYHLPQAIAFKNIFKYKGDFNPSILTQDDIAFLQYTGGTTGIAKGAVLTHGNMTSNVMQAYTWIKPIHKEGEDVVVTALPLYHIFSLTANCLTFLKTGAKNILITNPRDLKGFIKDIKHSQFTAFTGVNTLFNALLNHPDFKKIDFSHLKLTLSGGMSLQKSVAVHWKEETHSRILEAYGLTETSPAVTINPMYIQDYNGSIGLPLPSTEISIRNDAEEEVTLGETGELCIKGPQVMHCYWQRPDETALVFTKDGFLKTGDIAKVDHQGFVYLVDRKKDMILVSGFNVYPNEVEQIIGNMPEVQEVGVIGVKNNNSGERVKACIVKKDPALTEEQVIAYCRQHLTSYKVPKVVEFYSELPKTNVGKILRRALR